MHILCNGHFANEPSGLVEQSARLGQAVPAFRLPRQGEFFWRRGVITFGAIRRRQN